MHRRGGAHPHAADLLLEQRARRDGGVAVEGHVHHRCDATCHSGGRGGADALPLQPAWLVHVHMHVNDARGHHQRPHVQDAAAHVVHAARHGGDLCGVDVGLAVDSLDAATLEMQRTCGHPVWEHDVLRLQKDIPRVYVATGGQEERVPRNQPQQLQFCLL